MSGQVSIHDMQSFAESLTEPDVRMSSDLGNVIDLGPVGDLGDDLGFGLLTNAKVTRSSSSNSGSGSSSSMSSSSSNTVHIPMSHANSADISIGPLEPLESMTFEIPTGDSGAVPEFTINRESSSSSDNQQTATGPGVNLTAPLKRLSPEEERKEKADMINKLNRMESKGFQISRRFTMDNSLDEIKQEFERLMDARNLESSIKFQRQMMMGVVTGMELMNNKFNPFDWQLDGWSESVHENVDDYDEVFEELYDKYKGKGNMPPEARLLFMMVGSGFMFHMSNSFFRSKMGNMTMDDILKNNPALAKQMAAAAAQAAGPGFGNFMGAAMGMPPGMPQGQGMGMGSPISQQPPTTGAFFQAPNAPMSQQQQNPAPVRREMRGPSGVDDILQTFQEVRNAEVNVNPMFAPMPSGNLQPIPRAMNSPPAQAALAEIQSIHSEDMRSQAESSATGRTGGGGRRRKAQLPVGNTMTLNV
uniref:Uncharacterized protein n=1 Tax=viral metagenome TaxID=1070528 RepID=A0A6C0DFF0_9ZZZZ